MADLVNCSASILKESDLNQNNRMVPTFGAAGLSGYTNICLSERDSILITKDGSGVGSLRYISGKHSFLGTFNSLSPKDVIDLPYVYYALFSVNFGTYKTGQAIPHIYFKDYAKESIYCPAYEDQKRLAKGLELIDSKIEYQRTELQGLLSIKAYLLANLFI